jgi:hypothetical protein
VCEKRTRPKAGCSPGGRWAHTGLGWGVPRGDHRDVTTRACHSAALQRRLGHTLLIQNEFMSLYIIFFIYINKASKAGVC